jgi:hypothetical protein
MPLFTKKDERNILEMVPKRVVENFTDIDGLVTLNLPKFKRPFFSKWLIPQGKSSFIHIKFDKMGSHVWRQIDGKKNLQEICNTFKPALTEDEIVNLEERSAKFLTELYKSRFINFMEDKQ